MVIHPKVKKIVRRVFRIILITALVIIVVVITIVILIQTDPVQNFARKKIVSYLQSKLHTRVEIGGLHIEFPKKVVLKNIYLEDQRHDTLLYGGRIEVDVSMFQLLRSKLQVNEISLDQVTVKVKRLLPDSTFNFNYIINAFSGNPETKPKQTDTASSFGFEIGKIHLRRISATYKDDATGNDDSVYLGDFETTIKTFDLNHSAFSIPDIHLSGVNARIHQYKPILIIQEIADTVSKKSSPFSLQPGTIDLTDIAFDYRNDVNRQSASLRLGTFNAAVSSIDLAKINIRLKNLELKNSVVSIRMGKQLEVENKSEYKNDSPADNSGWKVELAKLSLDSNRIQYDDDNKKPLANGIDYNHLMIDHFIIHGDNLSADPNEYRGHIEQISFDEKQGFAVKKLSGFFLYNNRQTQLKDLVVLTNRSSLNNESSISYSSVDMISKNPGDIQTNLNFNHCVIAAKDVLTFVPSLMSELKGNENSLIRLNGKLSGPIKNLTVSNLEISGLSSTVVKISGNIKGLPDIKKMYYDIHLPQLTTSRNDFTAFIPPNSIPQEIHIPDKISVHGSFKGTIDRFNVGLNTETSDGNAAINGSMDIKSKSYDLHVTTEGLNLGHIMSQENQFGKISLETTARGNGFDYKTMNSTVHVHLAEGAIKGYVYKDFLVDGSFQNGKADIQSSIHDENINFDLKTNADFTAKFPAVILKLKLDTLNPYALHLMKDSLHLKLALDADFQNTDPDALQGNLKLHDIVLVDSTRRLNTDSVVFIANRKDSIEDIRFRSEMADIDWTGTFKTTEVADALKQTISRYYSFKGLQHKDVSPQNWKLQIRFRVSPMLLEYLPSLKGTDSVNAAIQFNSSTSDLNLSLAAPKIQYGQQVIRQLQIAAATHDSLLNYRIDIASAVTSGLQLDRSSVEGHLAGNKITTEVVLRDQKDKERYHLGGLFSQENGGIRFSFAADSLLLNYDKWNIAKDNFVLYDSSGLMVLDFKLEKADQSLMVNSSSPSTSSPIDIDFTNFRINTLTSFAGQDSLYVDGLLNGKMQIQHILNNPVFTSDLHINDLAFKKDTLGNLVVKVNNERQNEFTANISLKGRNTDVEADGSYYTGESTMNLKLDIREFNLAVIRGFSAGQLQDIRGNLKGNLTASGNLTEPVLTGALHFENAFFKPAISGETLKLPSDDIVFNNDGLNFHDFLLLDSAGNKATINGNIYTNDYKDYRFGLTLGTVNFRLINAPKEPNRLFYGKLNLDAKINLTGDLGSAKANANIRVNKQTNLTVILPSDDPELQSREGVVVFVDKEHPVDTVTLRSLLDSLSAKAELKGWDVAATVETDSSAQFTMIIDERNGDALAIRGRAFLTGGIDRAGTISLNGNYQLDNGAYNVSLSLLKRKFDIVKGSTMTWSGDPTKARIDITAAYIVKTAPIDLMQQQLAGKSQDEVNKYKQKLPFRVNLKMTGELLEPVIKFDITLPPDQLTLWPDVDTKLQQLRTDESEMNKQVFALLLLSRFVDENPFVSASGSSDAGTVARESVSRILTDQLNQFAGSLIKGVDVNFDLNSDKDYSTGQGTNQTQLDVDVSKNLFSDRVRVTVGSNFQLENTYPGQNTSTIAGNVSVDYRLSKDGRYMLRAYRKDQYETIVEGQVVETGVSFILTLDYNKFRELFQKSKDGSKSKSPKSQKSIETTDNKK
jgi:hypothetical protein